MTKLFLMFKDKVISEIPVSKPITTIGRSTGNDIPIDNLSVSSFHAKIVQNSGVFVIEDLKSTNGTFVNNRRISQCQLNNNDQIVIGKHTLVFSVITGDDESKADDNTTHKAILGTREKTVMFDARLLNSQQPRPKTPLLGGFKVVTGQTEKKEYLLAEPVSSIGKAANCEIRLSGFFTPAVAAEIIRNQDEYSIKPTSFFCKPLVNGSKIKEPRRLVPGDIVTVCSLKMKFFIKD